MKKLNRGGALLVFLLSHGMFTGCDPVGCLDVEIQNNTDQGLIINWVSGVEALNRSKSIGPGEKAVIEEDSYCEVAGMPTVLDYEVVYDSITLLSLQNEVLKTWLPESESKNIYDTVNDWQLRSTGKWDSAILFVIEESDLE